MRRLLIRSGAIGDCILALPALEAARADYTEVWVPSRMVPLIRFADRVRAISATGLELLGLPDLALPAQLLETLRSFDSIYSWYGANRDDLREAVAELDLPFTFFSALPPPDASIHAADFFAQQVGAAAALPTIECPRAPGGFLVIQPFSGSARKNWPLDRYRELARRLAIPVRWCAGPEDELPGAVRIHDLYQLAQWLATARVYAGNDSGVTHLAAAIGLPVVALFGPTDPRVWAPRGPHVRVVSAAAMNEIPVDAVLDAVRQVW